MNFNNRRYPEGYHVLSQYWKNYKKSLPNKLPENLVQIALGVCLGDATLYKAKYNGTKFKIEQGYKHKAYAEELCLCFKDWTFYRTPHAYFAKKGSRSGKIKSYSFRTFAHPAFDFLWELFILSGKKSYKEGTILEYLNPLGFAYWIADDGSLNKKSNEVILHTQGFSFEENQIICKELNIKFYLNAIVKPHKNKYWVLYIPAKNSETLRRLLVNLSKSMSYKLPKKSKIQK